MYSGEKCCWRSLLMSLRAPGMNTVESMSIFASRRDLKKMWTGEFSLRSCTLRSSFSPPSSSTEAETAPL